MALDDCRSVLNSSHHTNDGTERFQRFSCPCLIDERLRLANLAMFFRGTKDGKQEDWGMAMVSMQYKADLSVQPSSQRGGLPTRARCPKHGSGNLNSKFVWMLRGFAKFNIIAVVSIALSLAASFEECVDELGPSTHGHHSFDALISIGPKKCQTCTVGDADHCHTVHVGLPVT